MDLPAPDHQIIDWGRGRVRARRGAGQQQQQW
jgi:hypothetical protein